MFNKKNNLYVPAFWLLVGFFLSSTLWWISVNRYKYEKSATELMMQVHALEALHNEVPTFPRRLLFGLADGNVINLAQLPEWVQDTSVRKLKKVAFKKYQNLRPLLPEASNIPSYVQDDEKEIWAANNNKIQQFLNED